MHHVRLYLILRNPKLSDRESSWNGRNFSFDDHVCSWKKKWYYWSGSGSFFGFIFDVNVNFLVQLARIVKKHAWLWIKPNKLARYFKVTPYQIFGELNSLPRRTPWKRRLCACHKDTLWHKLLDIFLPFLSPQTKPFFQNFSARHFTF